MREDDRLLTMADLKELVPYSKPTIYHMIREGRFPKQVRLGPNRVAWLRSEVVRWAGERAAEREAPTEPKPLRSLGQE
jgi:prophage regulatory protein